MNDIMDIFTYLLDWRVADSFYWFSALVGSGFFIIQLFLSLVGIAIEEDFSEEAVLDAGKIKWLSKQALTGFFMMFGWSALTCRKEFNLNEALTISISLMCGIFAIFATGLIFKLAKKLHSSGTVFKIDETIGQEAIVYQRIPPFGCGKISVTIANFIREIDACSNDNIEIPSFVRVKIVNKVDDKTVLIERI